MPYTSFCQKMFQLFPICRTKEHIGASCYRLSPLKNMPSTAMVNFAVDDSSTIQQFGKLLKGRSTFIGMLNQQSKKRSNSAVLYMEGNVCCYGIIQTFFKVTSAISTKTFAVMHCLPIAPKCTYLEYTDTLTLSEHGLNRNLFNKQAAVVLFDP